MSATLLWKEITAHPIINTAPNKAISVSYRLLGPYDDTSLDTPCQVPVRFNKTIENVEANRDRVAVSRGPLVYGAEEPDNGYTQRYFVDEDPAASRIRMDEMDGVLSGIVSITIPAKEVLSESVEPTSLKLIPYYARSNRDVGTMSVWLPEKKEHTKPNFKELGIKKFANIRASVNEKDKGNNSVAGLYQWFDPEHSHERLSRWSSLSMCG